MLEMRAGLTVGAHRALTLFDVLLDRLQRSTRELALALYTPELEEILASDYFGRAHLYSNSAQINTGLQPFEKQALSRFFPPPPASLFVPGAGGGREALALCKLGYNVDVAERSPQLARAARSTLRGYPESSILEATVQTWGQNNRTTYDGIVTGWTMWMSLLAESERIETLLSFRRACPRGPVLISFWQNDVDPRDLDTSTGPLKPPPYSDPPGRWERLMRRIVRRGLLRRDAELERGIDWWRGLFLHRVTERELRYEAQRAGYAIVHYERAVDELPHAVLVPTASKPVESA